MSTTITPTEQNIEINVNNDVIDINVTNEIVDVNATTQQIDINVAGAYPIPNPVLSVFGRTGVVVATEGDYTLTQLGDVTLTSPTNGQVLKYNGTTWVNGTDAGGLTSVGLSMPSAFTVTNSPLTSNGTIAVTGAGTTAQYVRGDGTLATFPSIITQAQNLVTEVYNRTGATLTKGTIVYINGGQGNLPTVTKALAVGDSTSAQTYGVVQTDITNMNNGYVVVAGRLSDLDTQAYTEGTQLYLSSTTAGTWTSTKQYAPAHLVYVGIVVRAHPTQGIVEIKIQNGYELDEIHNVAAQTPTNNDGLFWESATNLWKNKSIATILGGTPVTGTGTTNYLAKFTGSSTIGIGQVLDDGTSVLIGTTSSTPNVKVGIYSTTQRTLEVISTNSNALFVQSPAAFIATISNGTWYTNFTNTGRLDLAGDLLVNTIANATTDTDRFLVSDSGVIKYRTGAELLSDIGGQGALINPITGTGTSGQVAYFNGTNSITSGSSFAFDSVNNRLSIGGANTAGVALRVLGSEYSYFNGGLQTGTGLTQNGNGLMTLGSAGNALFRLNANGTTNASRIEYQQAGTTRWFGGINTNSDFSISTDGAMANGLGIFLSSRNVVIGQGTDSGYRLDVNGTARVQSDMIVNTLVLGRGAGNIATNTAFGVQTLNLNTTGNNNTAIGNTALSSNLTGVNNTATGSEALYRNTGTNNTAFGNGASREQVAANANTSVGQSALYNNSTGSNNTAIGRQAGAFIADGSTANAITDNSIYIGFLTRALANNQTNQIVIGHQAIGLGSNTTVLGNASTVTTAIYGDLLIGTTTSPASTKLTVSGSETASSAIARGQLLNTTLVAAANNDVLVGLDINPTFTNGAFTGVRNYDLRLTNNLYGKGGGTTDRTFRILLEKPSGTIPYTFLDAYADGTTQYFGIGGLPGQSNYAPNYIYFLTASTNTGAGTRAMSILPSGNINIGSGITDAGFRLDVNGTARVSGLITGSDGATFGNTVNITRGFSTATFNVGDGGTTNSSTIRIIKNATGNAANLYFRNVSTDFTRLWLNASNNFEIANQSTSGLFATFFSSSNNIGIGTGTDLASSILTIESTTKGFLPPRMTTTQKNAIATPATGLAVYDTTLNQLSYYNGTSWINV